MENTTQTTSAHTATPWKSSCASTNPGEAFVIESATRTIAWTSSSLNQEGEETITREDEANAEFIVRACNNHELLLEICSDLLIGIKNGTVHLPQTYVDQLEEVTAKANGNDPKPAETSNPFRFAKTGLSDENGDSLYEGDVVEDVDDKTLGVVRWANGSFHLCTNPDASGEWWELLSDTCNTVRKVGNVYQNPDLLANGKAA